MSKKTSRKPRVFILILFSLFLILTLGPRVKTIYDLDKQKKALEARKADLSKEQVQLEKKLEESRSLQNMEKIAREQLGMIKEEETLAVPLVNDETN
jgi:cell division protein FtsB